MSFEGDSSGVSLRVQATTIAAWASQIEDLVFRKHPLLMALEKQGRIVRQDGGAALIWAVKKSVRSLEQFQDGTVLDYSRKHPLENARLTWGGYCMTDSRGPIERAQQRGKPALVTYLERLDQDVKRDFVQRFGEELWKRRADTVGGTGISGLAQWTSTNGTQTATHRFATTPNATYAGISTGYNSLSADTGTPVVGGFTNFGYGAWTPRITNVLFNDGTAAEAWATHADKCLRAAITEVDVDDAEPNHLIVLRNDSYVLLENLLDQRSRRLLPPAKAADRFGFEARLYFDGIPVVKDKSMPSTEPVNSEVLHGYILALDDLELVTLTLDGQKEGKLCVAYMENAESVQLNDLFALVCVAELKSKQLRRHGAFIELTP